MGGGHHALSHKYIQRCGVQPAPDAPRVQVYQDVINVLKHHMKVEK